MALKLFSRRCPAPIITFCPRCDIQIIPQEDLDYGPWGRRPFATYVCDHCHSTNLKLDESLDTTEGKNIRQIHRALRSGDWKKAVHKSTDEALASGS